MVAFDDSPERVLEANHRRHSIRRICIRSTGKKSPRWSLSPGVPLTHPAPHWTAQLAHGAGVEVIGDIELFCRERRLHAPDVGFIAITGTNGKSTTTALIAHILKTAGMDVQLGGNIGTAILLARAAAVRAHLCDRVLCPIRSTSRRRLILRSGVWINLSEDHIDRHGTISNYAAVKERLMAGVPNTGTAVIGVDDEWCKTAADRLGAAGKHVVRISVRRAVDDGLYIDGEQIMEAAGGKAHGLALLGKINSLRGIHNAQNAACAAAAALASGHDGRAIQRRTSGRFPGLPHRMEEVGRKGNVLFVNDFKATNADSTAQALACFHDACSVSSAASRKPAASPRSRISFRASAKPNLIGEAAPQFATPTLAGNVEHEIVEPSTGLLRVPPRMPRRAGSAMRSCCCRRPAPRPSISMRISRCCGDAFPRALVKATPDVQPPQTG